MLTVALTGGIASGKSVVARVFLRHDCALFEADAAARRLMAPGGPAFGPLTSAFGTKILGPDGTIDRAKLAALVFGSAEDRGAVNAIVHPLVAEARRREIRRLEAEGKTKIFVNEAALTIEAGLAGEFDKVVVVWCPPEVQVERLGNRDGISREEALRKIGAQMPSEERLRFADYTIDTSGSFERTIALAEAVYARLLEDFERKRERLSRRKVPS
jgi:dephospho-CoA kinase